MKYYKVTFDVRKNLFDELPLILASTPKKAAEIYAGAVMRHNGARGGEIVVKEMNYPYRSYVYNRFTTEERTKR